MSKDIYEVNSALAYGNRASIIPGEDITYMKKGKTSPPKSPKLEKQPSVQDLIKINIENQEASGIKVAESLSQYYQFITGYETIQITPRLLPYTLSLTTYGIASIKPGDTFQVDYLPQMYLDDTYLQIMKVTHDVGSDGWHTTIDTQFRLKSYTTTREYISREIRLSPNAISNLGITDFFWNSDKGWHDTWPDQTTLNTFLPYITDIKVLNRKGYDLVLDFITTDRIGDVLSKNDGELRHRGYLSRLDFQDQNFIRYVEEESDIPDFAFKYTTENIDAGKTGFQYQYLPSVGGLSRYAIYARDVVVKPNERYRFYITGKKIMLWRLKDVQSYDKQEEYMSDIIGKMNQDATRYYQEYKEAAAKSPQYKMTCFVPETKVTMHDNSLKNIEDIVVGDKVLSFNISTSEFGVDEVVKLPEILGNYKKIIATYEDGTINEFSPAHPFYIDGKGWSSYDLTDELITGEKEGAPTWSSMDLKQLEVGDYCINTLNEKSKIVSLEETDEYVDMYNLEHLSNNKNWFANGILVKE